jgi:hypothetical protein
VHLSVFAGLLQIDGYAAYESLAKGGAVRLAYCWSHVRRQFYDLAAASPIATETLCRIAALYRKSVCPRLWGGWPYTAPSRVARMGRAVPHYRRASRGVMPSAKRSCAASSTRSF